MVMVRNDQESEHEMQDRAEEMRSMQTKPGEPLQRVLAARGIDISLEEAARLATVLLRFAEQGLLVPVEPPQAARCEATPSELRPAPSVQSQTE